MTPPEIPHLRIVVGVSAFVLVGFAVVISAFVLVGFAVVSGYVIGWSEDLVTKGNIIGTWQNFALLAVGFWIGSSSAGKAKAEQEPSPKSASTAASSVADAAVERADEIAGK